MKVIECSDVFTKLSELLESEIHKIEHEYKQYVSFDLSISIEPEKFPSPPDYKTNKSILSYTTDYRISKHKH